MTSFPPMYPNGSPFLNAFLQSPEQKYRRRLRGRMNKGRPH